MIGAVLIPGALAPKLVTREMIAGMKTGAVVVDVAIDQGGCFETSHADDALRSGLRGRRRHPLLRREHARRRAGHLDEGADERDAALRRGDRRPRAARAVAADPALAKGVNVLGGKVTYEAVAEAHGLATRRSRTRSRARLRLARRLGFLLRARASG